MNKRQVLIFWVIAIALGGAVAAIKLTHKQTAVSTTLRGAGKTLFESFPVKDIAAVEIQGTAGTVTIVRKDNRWTLTQREDYPANATFVNELIRTLSELKVTRSIEAGPSFAPHFGMDESATNPQDRGLTATFKDAAGKELAKVTLGKNIEKGADTSPMGGGNAVGRYIRNHADTAGFYAVSEVFPSVSAEAARWLADDFISPEKIKTITLSQKGKDDAEWKLSRDTEEAEVKLDGAAATEVLDTTVGAPLKSLFSYARFEDVVPAAKAAELGDAANKRNAVIGTFEGFTYTLTITPAKAPATPPSASPQDAQSPPADKVYLTVTVTAELPKERKKEEGEKPEDAKTKDTAFAERLKTLTDKLAKEKALAGRTFEVAKSTVDALLKDRSQLIAKATPPPAADPNSGSVQQLPGGIIAKPPVQATTPPVEAVTPPIAVPPADDKSPAGDKPPTDAAPPKDAAPPAGEKAPTDDKAPPAATPPPAI